MLKLMLFLFVNISIIVDALLCSVNNVRTTGTTGIRRHYHRLQTNTQSLRVINSSTVVQITTRSISLLPSLPLTRPFHSRTQLLHHITNNHSHDSLDKEDQTGITNPSFSDYNHNQQPYKHEILTPTQIQTIDELVLERSDERDRGNYKRADILRNTILKSLDGFEFINNYHCDDGNNIALNLNQNQNNHQYSILLRDIPRKEGGGSVWEVVQKQEFYGNHEVEEEDDDADDIHDNHDTLERRRSVLDMAHHALNCAIQASESGLSLDTQFRNDIKNQIMQKLQNKPKYVRNQLQGRKAADVAFYLTLSGIYSPLIHAHLIRICSNELMRFGKRSSCRSVDIMHIVERLAASGAAEYNTIIHSTNHDKNDDGHGNGDGHGHNDGDIHSTLTSTDYPSSPHSPSHEWKQFTNIAIDCLEWKLHSSSSSSNIQHTTKPTSSSRLEKALHQLKLGTYDVHSNGSLLWLWRFAARQRKAKNSSINEHLHKQKPDDVYSSQNVDESYWGTIFDDTKRPLVIDVGCGMGVSILGLSSIPRSFNTSQSHSTTSLSSKTSLFLDQYHDIQWQDCNFIGVDLSNLTINYANSIVKMRRTHSNNTLQNGKNNVHFCVEGAGQFLQRVKDSYQGPVKLIMIQFPTPFRLSEKGSANIGNSQLPTSAAEGFMVNESILRLCHDILSKYSQYQCNNGALLLQSNCEDVATKMAKTARDSAKFCFLNTRQTNTVTEDLLSTDISKLPRRTQTWISIGGERASGQGWLSVPFLPTRGATETEISCNINDTPIHRCVLIPE